MTNPLRALFGTTDFAADAALLRKYAGIELDQATFDRYADSVTLSSKLGTKAQLEKDHHGFGTPRGVGDGEICARILHILDEKGIHFDSTPGTPLGKKLTEYLGACNSANLWLNLPERYFKPGLPVEQKQRETWLWLAGVKP